MPVDPQSLRGATRENGCRGHRDIERTDPDHRCKLQQVLRQIVPHQLQLRNEEALDPGLLLRPEAPPALEGHQEGPRQAQAGEEGISSSSSAVISIK